MDSSVQFISKDVKPLFSAAKSMIYKETPKPIRILENRPIHGSMEASLYLLAFPSTDVLLAPILEYPRWLIKKISEYTER